MGEHSESKSFWKGFKQFWAERFHLDDYSKILNADKSLPHWDSTVVEEFIASDSVHGPTLKKAREAGKFGAVGAAVGAVAVAGPAYKWSKSLHGAALAFAVGAVAGTSFGIEVANHRYQLYSSDTMAAQGKFFEWLQKRS